MAVTVLWIRRDTETLRNSQEGPEGKPGCHFFPGRLKLPSICLSVWLSHRVSHTPPSNSPRATLTPLLPRCLPKAHAAGRLSRRGVPHQGPKTLSFGHIMANRDCSLSGERPPITPLCLFSLRLRSQPGSASPTRAPQPCSGLELRSWEPAALAGPQAQPSCLRAEPESPVLAIFLRSPGLVHPLEVFWV